MVYYSFTQVVSRLTKDIVETYKICNPQFQFSEELNPKRFLTSPSIGVLNDGHDNANSDLILAVNLVLANLETQRRFDAVNYLPYALLENMSVPFILKEHIHFSCILENVFKNVHIQLLIFFFFLYVHSTVCRIFY